MTSFSLHQVAETQEPATRLVVETQEPAIVVTQEPATTETQEPTANFIPEIQESDAQDAESEGCIALQGGDTLRGACICHSFTASHT
jgi:hypothetical protein